MIDNPLVTIIIPTFNSEKTLDRCIKSIKNQTYKNIEIFVIDNYSKEEEKMKIEFHGNPDGKWFKYGNKEAIYTYGKGWSLWDGDDWKGKVKTQKEAIRWLKTGRIRARRNSSGIANMIRGAIHMGRRALLVLSRLHPVPGWKLSSALVFDLRKCLPHISPHLWKKAST